MKAVMARTTFLYCIFLAFLLGLAGAKFVRPDVSVYIFFGILALYALIASKRITLFSVVSAMLVCLILGNLYGAHFFEKLQRYETLYGKNVTLLVRATEDAIYSDKGQLKFRADKITNSLNNEKLVGSIAIEGFGVPMVYKGDYVQVEGKMYPRRSLQQGSVTFAKITVVNRDESAINNIRRKFIVGLQNALPEPMASLAAGLLIGQRSTLPEELSNSLTKVGLIHIVAVSGFNLTIIIFAVRRLLAGQSRYQVVVFSFALLTLFILFTNFEPSIVRASLVSVLSLLAWYYGRAFKPILLLLIVAAITAAFNPIYIWYSVGWYLSFAAFFGIIVLAPLIKQRALSERHRHKVIPSLLIETTAAQICTMPIILFVFGRIQNISIISNLLVAPFIPLAMLFSFIAGLAGIIGPIFIAIFSIPAKLVLDYILSASALLSQFSFAEGKMRITFWQMVYFYALIAWISIILLQKNRQIRKIAYGNKYE